VKPRPPGAPPGESRTLDLEWRGLVPYTEGLELQHELVRNRRDGIIPDTLILLEHPPVITFGRRYDATHLKVPREELAARGVEIHRVERGGQATVHGPGQLVGYLIADLYHHGRDIHRFVFNLEESIIRFLGTRGIAAGRKAGRGVWVGDAKIASVGIAVRRNITMHGFSLNVANDLGAFSWIVACGDPAGSVCSLSSLTGKREDPATAGFELAGGLRRVFGYGDGLQ